MQDGHLVANESQKLTGNQQRWQTHEKELHIVVHCVKKLKHYVGGKKTKQSFYSISMDFMIGISKVA